MWEENESIDLNELDLDEIDLEAAMVDQESLFEKDIEAALLDSSDHEEVKTTGN